MKSLKQLSFLKLLKNMSNCNFNFSESNTQTISAIVDSLNEFGKTDQRDIHDVIRADVGSLQSIGSKAQSRKHLLIVCIDETLYYYWFQIHTEYVQGPPQKYSPYPRPTTKFLWVLNVIEATNENCQEQIFKNHISRPQTQIPNNLLQILDTRCPPQFRMACDGAKHVIIRYGSL
tara:strand:- start:241 stop:765 length:525 start_codon:yes stop_codon:yes gene_type:complete